MSILLFYTAKYVDEAGQAHRPNTNQCIVSLDMDQWRVSCDTTVVTGLVCLVKIVYSMTK